MSVRDVLLRYNISVICNDTNAFEEVKRMKERYEVAEMEVVEFEVEDVIKTSNELPDQGAED